MNRVYETIYNSVSDGIVIYGLDGRFLEVNQITCDELGYSKNELLQMMAADVIPPEYVKSLREQIAEKIKNGGGILETVCVRKDVSFVPVELNVHLTEYAEAPAILVVVRNITERKQTEETLRRSERKHRQASNLLQGVIESPKDVVILALDREYRYITFNKNHQATMEHIWGVNIEIDSCMLDFIKDPDHREKAKINFDRAFAGEAFTLIEEYGDIALERRWYENVYSPLKDEKGNVIGLTLILTDITKRRETESALVQSIMLAEEANRTKSEFLANMSHELRTPLTSVIGFSDVLGAGIPGDLNAKQLEYVSNIYKSGMHLLRLINNILEVSNIESGNMDFNPERLNLQELIGEAVMLVEPLAKQKHINLKSEAEFKNQEIWADRAKLRQIIYHLLNNAIKFAPENDTVSIASKIIDNEVHVSISDNGIGIPDEEIVTIFEPFKQVDSSSKRKYGGTGLGLTLVKQFVEMHNGDISVESETNKGSTFRFIMPTC